MEKRTGFNKFIALTFFLMVFTGYATVARNNNQLSDSADTSGRFDEGTVIVVAMHGIPAPAAGRLMMEFMMLEFQLEAGYGADDPKKAQRFEEIDEKLKNWPLDEKHPYNVGAVKLGKLLEQETRAKVFVGFNEFCAPSLDKVIEDAVKEKPKKIMIITSLQAPGNDHAENPEGDVLKSVLDAQKLHPDIEFVYAWPYSFKRLARLLYSQLLEFATKAELTSRETVTVLAVHGTPAIDLPAQEMMKFMMLKYMGGTSGKDTAQRTKRLHEQDEKIRNWPRTDEDAYWTGTKKLREVLEKMTDSKVMVGYNEFCGPSIEEVFKQAVKEKAKKVLVVSPMWEPDNPHGGYDVPQAVRRAKRKYPEVEFVYAWPYSYDKIVSILYDQLVEFKSKPGFTGK